ncbi:MAG: hypothetical protein HYZ27_02155 [Deltaproteobacteria bacterium]|nr:hypothetical protein [Deltaproteobacteria bacterium]
MAEPIDLKQLMSDTMAQLKSAYDKAQGTDVAPLLMAVRESIGALREAVLEIREQNAALKERGAGLEEALRLKPSLVRHRGVYWTKGDPDPWCPTCWEIDHRAIHLNRSDLMAGRLCSCSRCQYSVSLDVVSPPKEWPG